MEHADPARADAAEKLAEECDSLRRRQPLKEKVGVEQIKGAMRRRKLSGGLEVDVGDRLLRRFASRGVEHRRRTIDCRDGTCPSREWNGQPSRTAAEFEDRLRRELGCQPTFDGVKHGIDEQLAAVEELALMARHPI